MLGHVLTYEERLRGFRTLCGRRRAAYWRSLGYPNLQKAWAAHSANAARRREEKAQAAALEKAEKQANLRAYQESTRDDL